MNFCATSARIWQLVGYALFVLKIVVPLIIIILGIIDFTKALAASKDDALNDAIKAVITRFIIGIAIFFIPLIISTIFAFIKSASPFIAKAEGCEECLLKPFGDSCQTYKAQGDQIRADQAASASKPNEGGYEVRTPGCYNCNDELIWTDNAPIGCTRLDRDTATGKKFTEELCKEVNDDPNRKGHTGTAQKPQEGDSGSGGSAASNGNIVYVGDSQMSGICSAMNLKNCFYCVGGGLDWLNGSVSRCLNTNPSTNVINDVAESYDGKDLTIVIYLGTNDVAAPAMPGEYILKYRELLEREWNYGKLIVTNILPLRSDTVPDYPLINQSLIDTFNSDLKDLIKKENSSKMKYCDLGLTRADLEYNDGVHFSENAYKTIYKAIQSKCL